MIASDVLIINCGTHMIVDGDRYLAPTAHHLSFSKPVKTTLYKHIEYRPLPSMSSNKSFIMKPTNTQKTSTHTNTKYVPGPFRRSNGG